MKLSGGGDGQSFVCPRKFYSLQNAETICADIEWEFAYILLDQPHVPLFKRARYELLPGHKRWAKIALELPRVDCKSLTSGMWQGIKENK
jgi:hypothetical protein